MKSGLVKNDQINYDTLITVLEKQQRRHLEEANVLGKLILINITAWFY